jgi:hypothetical protein
MLTPGSYNGQAARCEKTLSGRACRAHDRVGVLRGLPARVEAASADCLSAGRPLSAPTLPRALLRSSD